MDTQVIMDFLEQYKEVIGIAAALIAIWIFFKNGLIFALRKIVILFKFYFARSDKKKMLVTRKEYMDELIKHLGLNSKSYRAIIVGPIFLHPNWVFERRNKISSTSSYDDKLYEFVMSKSLRRNHNIKIILRNTERYKTKLDKLVLPEERERFKQDVLLAIDALWGMNNEKGPDLVCSNVGHFRIDVIFDNAVVSAARLSDSRPVSGGMLSLSKQDHQVQTQFFDQVFNELSEGNSIEVNKLREYVRVLWSE